MSEYGGSPREIAEQWTPAQVLVMSDRIRQRRAMREAQAMELAYVVEAAVPGGAEGFRSFEKVVKELRQEGGVKPKQTPLAGLIKGMGLKVR
jgi:hypothetical protein